MNIMCWGCWSHSICQDNLAGHSRTCGMVKNAFSLSVVVSVHGAQPCLGVW